MTSSTLEFYKKHVETAWPDRVPKLSEAEAERAARRLYRFVFKKPCPLPTVITSGRNHSYIRSGKLRVNPENGWKELVHGLSHSFYGRLHPDRPGHSGQHGSLERHMVQHVLDSGWLEGKLKPKISSSKVIDPKQALYERTLASIERWESKQRRAENAIKKLDVKRKYYEKKYNLRKEE